MKIVNLTQQQLSKVDDSDYRFIVAFRWQAQWNNTSKSFYAVRTESFHDGKRWRCRKIYLHRFLTGLNYGDKRQVDHINHDTLDNRRENIRVCNRSENQMNRTLQKNNSTGFKGVSFRKDCHK